MHRAVVLLLLAVCMALALISGFLAMRLFQRGDSPLAGSWRMRLDLSETARARANIWLCAAELGDQVDTAETMPPISVSVLLRLEADGSWSRSVEADSYEAACGEARKALAAALRELLCLRAADAGREIGSEEQAERRIEQAIGMSSERYLTDYGPALLPALSELRGRYDGGGAWDVSGARIRLEERTARFLADERLLVLYDGEEAEVYERVGG